jgi:UDP-N-acetylmuramate dehydrogenase
MTTPATMPEIPGVELREDAPVGNYTSIGVPCRARALASVETAEGLGKMLGWVARHKQPFYLMGGGTNLIFCDKYYDGIIVKLGQAFRDVKIHENLIRAGCSIPLSRLLNISIAENLTGLEFAWDIPGTLGGAVIGNAGAFSESICELIEAVKGFDQKGSSVAAKRGGFTYGHRFCSLRGMIVTEVILALQPGDPEAIQQRLRTFKEQRWIQPAGVKTCGCMFKNPPNARAGKLIEEAGLKGYAIGGIKISPDHANFFINHNQATGEDIESLIEHVRETVRSYHNIELELEAQLVHSP